MATAVEAAEECPHFLMSTVPRFCTVDVKEVSSHSRSMTVSAG